MGFLVHWSFIYLFFLLYGLIGCSCPNHDDIPNCECRQSDFYTGNVRLTCSEITDTGSLTKQISQFKGLLIRSLTLKNLSIPYLPLNSFEGLKVASLVINGGTFGSLGPDHLGSASPFDGLEDSLLHLSAYRIDRMDLWDWTLFSKMKSIKSIRIDFCKISTFSGWNRLAKIPQLTSFLLGETNLTSPGTKTLSAQTNLTTVTMFHNKLTTLTRNIFPRPAPKLKSMVFNHNMLRELPSDLFEEMPALSYVDFKYNQIMTIQENLLAPVWPYLRATSFFGNPLHCDGQLLWLFREIQMNDRRGYSDIRNMNCSSPPKLMSRPFSTLMESDLEMDNNLDK